MRKRNVFVCLFVLLMCAGISQATLETGYENWRVLLQPGESLSFTCIAHFIVSDAEFVMAPTNLELNLGGLPYGDISGWESAISEDSRTAYIYGNQITMGLDIFSYDLYFKWDNESASFDPEAWVTMDMVLFDGATPVFSSHFVGNPGEAGTSWSDPGEVVNIDDYSNPVIPEPATIFLLGLGSLFFIARKR